MTETPSEDRRISHWVHRVLLTGVLSSCLCLVVGLAIVMLRHQPRPEGTPPSFRRILEGMKHGQGLSWLELGLVLLMLTPVARVAALVIGWGLNRDWKFAAISFTVLLLLMASLVLGTG